MTTNFKEPKRFWSKVDVGKAEECWEWKAAINPDGYGQFAINHKMWLTHRVAWTLIFGPIPKGILVCHHCDNPSCCNPYHLFLGTNADNTQDSVQKGRMHRGEQHGNSKLTEESVLEIREMYTTGEWTQWELANEFGVGVPQISRIARRVDWAWLK